MNKAIITTRNEKFNEIYRIISDLTFESEEKLIRFCLSKGHSITEIADALSTSRTTLYSRYPNLKKGGLK